MRELTTKQKVFCKEYIIDNNATQAAIRAGYSPNTATEAASRLLAKVNVKAYVAELRLEATERQAVTVDSVIEALQWVIDTGMGKIDHDIVAKDGFGGGVTQTSSIKIKKTDLQAVKGAAELLGRYKGMFVDNTKVEHSGQILKRVINVNPTKKG